MVKAKQNKCKSNFKRAVEQKFKEYDQKLEALSSINVPEAIKEAVQAKDPPNDCEGEKTSKRSKDTRTSSSKSSKKDEAPMDLVQNDILAVQPQDQEEVFIHKLPNTG
ncbi:hypothetical protein Tco_0106805 [Tanacetum coccineum]